MGKKARRYQVSLFSVFGSGCGVLGAAGVGIGFAGRQGTDTAVWGKCTGGGGGGEGGGGGIGGSRWGSAVRGGV